MLRMMMTAPRTATTTTIRAFHILRISFLIGSFFIRPLWGSLVVQIPPGHQECYYVRVPETGPSIVSGNFDLLDDEVDSGIISAWLEKRTGRNPGDFITVWKSQDHDDEDTFSVEVDPNGKFGLCFQVSQPDDDSWKKPGVYFSVGFNLRVTAIPRTLEESVEGPDAERALSLLQNAGLVEDDWRNLIDHFDYLRNRESTHTILMHQIRDRVLGWTVVEAILVITMAVGQILYWKRFFEKKRYL